MSFQTGPVRQRERTRLMRRFVGEGRASIPIQMLPTCGFRSQELTACAHDRVKETFSCSMPFHTYKHMCSRLFSSCSIIIMKYCILFQLISKVISHSQMRVVNSHQKLQWKQVKSYLSCFGVNLIGHIFAMQSHNRADFAINLPSSTGYKME